MSRILAPTELVLNPDGSLYHCNLLPEHIADTVLLVGAPDRVPKISALFDRVEFTTQKREIVTHTGTKNGKRITVLSTGMGTDNIDIVINELDAAVNVDLKTRTIKSEHKQLNFIRLGTSGSLQPDIPPDSFLAGTHGLGFDGLLHYYQNTGRFTHNDFIDQLVEDLQWNPLLPRPYLVEADAGLLGLLPETGFYRGVTATASGFYGPQGRVLRLPVTDAEMNEKLSAFRHKDLRISNFEMETSALYGLSALLGHRALTVNCIIANRFTLQFSKDYQKAVIEMVGRVLEVLC